MREGPKEIILMEAFLELAKSVASASTCQRADVGCVLTTTDLSQVVAYGYNGVPRGYPNNGCSGTNVPGSCRDICVHAETNAVIKAPPGDKIAFVSCPPCRQCALALVNASVTAVVYADGHRHISEGVELLEELNVPHGNAYEVFNILYGVVEEDLESYDGWMEAKARRSRFGDI